MRIVIQRVRRAQVTAEGRVTGSIGGGMMVLVGVEHGDSDDDARWLAAKTASLRIFDDAQGVMNLSLGQAFPDAAPRVLAVSQFTLTASTRKGHRPSYLRAAAPDEARRLYALYCDEVARLLQRPTQRGLFGAHMLIDMEADGPVTIIIDTRLRE